MPMSCEACSTATGRLARRGTGLTLKLLLRRAAALDTPTPAHDDAAPWPCCSSATVTLSSDDTVGDDDDNVIVVATTTVTAVTRSCDQTNQTSNKNRITVTVTVTVYHTPQAVTSAASVDAAPVCTMPRRVVDTSASTVGTRSCSDLAWAIVTVI